MFAYSCWVFFSSRKKVTFSLAWWIFSCVFWWPNGFKSLVGKLGLSVLLHHLVVSIHTSLAHRIIESLRLEKTFKILKSNHKGILAREAGILAREEGNSSSDSAFPVPPMPSDSGGLLHVFICTFFFYSVI